MKSSSGRGTSDAGERSCSIFLHVTRLQPIRFGADLFQTIMQAPFVLVTISHADVVLAYAITLRYSELVMNSRCAPRIASLHKATRAGAHPSNLADIRQHVSMTSNLGVPEQQSAVLEGELL